MLNEEVKRRVVRRGRSGALKCKHVDEYLCMFGKSRNSVTNIACVLWQTFSTSF